MPGVLDRVNARLAAVRERPKALSLDEYARYFSFGGEQYPMVQTTYSQLDRERIARTSDWAARSSGPVFSLVLARMQVFSQVRFQWTLMNGSEPGDLFGSTDLKVLETPQPGWATRDLLTRMEWDASASGNAYIRRKGSTLHRLRPSWVTIVLGSQEDAESPAMASDTTLAGFFWNPPGGTAKFFLPSQVAHYAPIPDPDAHYLGQSWITPVLRELQGDQAATEHKYKFFEHAATPNIAIKFDPSVGIEAVRDFKELIEDEHEGVRNAYRTLFLGGGADPVTVGSTFRDMDYATIQGRAESRMASAAGVPPSWVGFAEGLAGSALNAGNFDSARRRLSDGTLTDLWGAAATSLQPIMVQPPGASLWCDARVPIMRQDAGDQANIQAQQAATIGGYVKDGFTPESAIAAVANNDVTLLKHTGRLSVQLWEPGTDSAGEPGSGESPSAPVPPPAPTPPVPTPPPAAAPPASKVAQNGHANGVRV